MWELEAKRKKLWHFGHSRNPSYFAAKQHKTAGATAAESVSFAVFLFLAARSPRLDETL